MEISLSKSGKTIVFNDVTYENGLETGSKFGFLKIQPGHDSAEVLEYAQSRDWHFDEEGNSEGIYTVSLAEEVAV
jgi:hypothetical protein